MRVVVRRLALAVVTVAVSLLLAPAVASAAPFDCSDAPAPEVPGRGLPAYFATEPDRLPPPGDPFAKDSTTTIHEQYGYAGLRWNTYDLGCGPDAVRDPGAIVGTTVGNWVLQLPVTAAAATDAVVGTALRPTFLEVFDPLILAVVTTLHENVSRTPVTCGLAPRPPPDLRLYRWSSLADAGGVRTFCGLFADYCGPT